MKPAAQGGAAGNRAPSFEARATRRDDGAARPSIRARLGRALLAWSLLWSLAVAGAAALATRHEVDELLDDALQAAAEVLAAALAADLRTAGVVATPVLPPSGRFAWQIVAHRGGEGALASRSSTAPQTPWTSTPTAGFSDAPGWRVFGAPLGHEGHMLYVAQTHDERREARTDMVLSAALAALAIALLAQVWLRGRVRHELEPLDRLAEHLRTHDPLAPDATLPAAERSELVPVHDALEQLSERLQRRLAHERAFIAHAAHALRTPLAGLDAQLATALKECPPTLQPRLTRARAAVSRLRRVVAALLALFRSDVEVRPEPVDLVSLVERLPTEELQVDVRGAAVLRADPDLLAAALVNLLDNAVRHGARRVTLTAEQGQGLGSSPPGLTPTPRGGVGPASGGRAPGLTVEDDGPGVDEARRAELQAALDAQAYEGRTGLGLMLADMVARAHGGRLQLLPAAHGFAVRLVLGASDEA